MLLPSSLCLSHNRVQFSRGAVKVRRQKKKKKKPIQVGTVGWGLGSSLATDLKQSKEWEAQHKGKPWDLISSLGRNLAREPLLSVRRHEKASHWPELKCKIHFLPLPTFDSLGRIGT